MSAESQMQDTGPTSKERNILDEVPPEFINEGEKLKAAYTGITLYGMSGQSTDEQSLQRGHFGGKAAGLISLFIYLQELINDLTVLKPELVPVMIKTKKGKFWVTDKQQALQLGKNYGLAIVQKGDWIPRYNKAGEEIDREFVLLEAEKDRYYYDYKGFYKRDTDIAAFAYNVARATGSFQGETKSLVTQALSNLKAVPVFPAMGPSMRPAPEIYNNIRENEDE